MGVDELIWHQLVHHHLMSQQGPHLIHTIKLKPMIKAQISGRMMHSLQYTRRKPSEKCLILIIIIVTEKHLVIMNKGDVGMVKRFSKKYGNKG